MVYRLTRGILITVVSMLVLSMVVSATSPKEDKKADTFKDYTYIDRDEGSSSYKDENDETWSDVKGQETGDGSDGDSIITDDKYSKILGSIDKIDKTVTPSLDCKVTSDNLVVKVEPVDSKAVVKTFGEEYRIDDKTSTITIPIPESVRSTYKSVTVKAEVDGAVLVKNVDLRASYNPIRRFLDSQDAKNPYGIIRLLLSIPILSK